MFTIANASHVFYILERFHTHTHTQIHMHTLSFLKIKDESLCTLQVSVYKLFVQSSHIFLKVPQINMMEIWATEDSSPQHLSEQMI